MKKGDLLKVEWLDIIGHNEWYDEDEALKESLAKCITHGILIAEKKDANRIKCLYIAATTGVKGDKQYNDFSIIPRSLITNITILKKGAFNEKKLL